MTLPSMYSDVIKTTVPGLAYVKWFLLHNFVTKNRTLETKC